MKSFIYSLFIFFIFKNLIYLTNCYNLKQRKFPDFQGTIAAFGDFNSDKFTDIFIIKNNHKCFQIILQEQEKTEKDKKVFKNFDSGELTNVCVFSLSRKDKNQIINIIPSDFDGDALMDVAILSKNELTNHYSLQIFKGQKTSIQETAIFVIRNLTSFPLVLDYNGDMISDILVTQKKADGRSSYVVYLGGKQLGNNKLSFDPFRKNIEISHKNSHAFIDLNGDGISDIFLDEKKEMYYYIADKDGYDKSKLIKYPNEYEVIGSSTFCDINNDGYIDHLIPVCKNNLDKTSCSIIIYDYENDDWNKLIDEIKVGDEHFYFDSTKSIGDKGSIIDIPIRLRHGYVNEYGYTGLMALMKNSKTNKWHIILLNVKKVDHKAKGKLNLNFEIININKTINDDPVSATFFDLYEDGIVDIILNYKSKDDDNYKFKALTLNDFGDVNFVKILVASGLCKNGICYEKDNYGGDKYLTPYGTNTPGSMVCFKLTKTGTNQIKSCAGQLSQSSNFALQMPYTIFGLGYYANYIELITVTIPTGNTKKKLQKKDDDQRVPNSQIVYIPNPINNPNAWKVKLFLTPSDLILKTLYTLIAICVVLIIIIVILHKRDMLEDLKENFAEFREIYPEAREFRR